MNYLGDINEDGTISFKFTTTDGSGGAVAPSTGFDIADFKIYKDGSDTERATNAGLTVASPFDSITGLHRVTIDTNNNDGDANFWAAGSDYSVVLDPDDETVDSQTVVAEIASFSIENRVMRGTDSAATASNLAILQLTANSILEDSGTTLPAEHDELADAIGDIPAIAAGATQTSVLVKVNGLPVDGVEVWFTTDEAGLNVVHGTFVTDAFGLADFGAVDPGTYFVHRQKAGLDFTVQTITVG